MDTTQIRIELTSDIHKLLIEVQTKRKATESKKISLGDLALEHLKLGLQVAQNMTSQDHEQAHQGIGRKIPADLYKGAA